MANLGFPGLFGSVLIVLAIGFITYICYTTFIAPADQAPHVSEIKISQAETPNETTLRVGKFLDANLPAERLLRRDHPRFLESLKAHWAGQAHEVVPAFIVQPRDAHEVATVVKALSQVGTGGNGELVKLGVRSGGHNPAAGFASAEGGVVLDMSLMNEVVLQPDRKSVVIGSGARWKDVYRTLDADGVCCAGGRAADVGVGGLILSGGLSLFSPQIGFVCDQAISFEVVLADGSVVNANADSYPDLAIALRGGGNNFGIVTRFTLYAFPQTKLWTGNAIFWTSQIPSLLDGFHQYARPEGYDPCTTVILSIAYIQMLNRILGSPNAFNTKPIPHPPALHWITKKRCLYSTYKIRTMSEVAQAINEPSDKRNLRWDFSTTTFVNDREMLHASYALFQAIAKRKGRSIKGFIFALVWQALLPSATKYHATNAMGIDTDQTLINVLISSTWARAEDDEKAYEVINECIHAIDAKSKEMGLYHPYKYANYASKGQEIFAGYGEKRLKWLRETARKYDPEGVFGKERLPGGFKLW